MQETPFGRIPDNWKLDIIDNACSVVTDYVANGSFKSLADNVEYQKHEDTTVLIRLVDYNNGFEGDFVYVNDHAYEFLAKSKLFGDEIIISNVGANVGTVFRCPYLDKQMTLGPNSVMIKFKQNDDFYFYWLKSPSGQHMIKSIVTGSAQPKFNKTNLRQVVIPVPSEDEQRKIAKILMAFDKKIEINNKINRNLEEQAIAIFEKDFSGVRYGDKMIGDYISPKRGKSLLAKNAVVGSIPVVAGGLSPATYHNEANTVAPVLTISASGANAGYVKLWNIPVWSSDSSFIDSKMTAYVYFWYVMLKNRQKEIFDSQTGSAQPHIYPQHIEIMPVLELDILKIEKYNEKAKPFFEMIGRNNVTNEKLSALRDTLLPKLMSGELDVSNLDL